MYGSHIVNHINGGLYKEEVLHVVRVVSNPARYHSRYRLAREQEAELLRTKGVILYTVECAYGDRNFEVTEANNPHHLQLRTNSEIWIKEAMINLGVRHLIPRTAKYIAWIDADISFNNPNWAIDTIHQLQHFAVIQPWADCVDLGPHGSIMQHHRSFGRQHQHCKPKKIKPTDPYEYAHPGYAWACTRKFWEATEGLFDCAILGSGDHHMSYAMISDSAWTVHKALQDSGYCKRLKAWEWAARRITHDQIGYVEGYIRHHFHGSKKTRYYTTRWGILVQNEYDPDKDLYYDHQGLIQLTGKPKLEHDILKYNRSRHEDSTEE